jgi:acyl carrier protein
MTPGSLRQFLPPLPMLSDLPLIDVSSSSLTETLVDVPQAAGERLQYFQDYSRQIVADVLRLPATEVTVTQNVMELGMDSIMIMELIQRVDRDLELILHPRDVFERPTIEELAEHLNTLYWLNLKADPAAETEEREEFEL